jgi:hypothetical protein
LLAREAPQTHPDFKELIEVKGEVPSSGDHGAHGPV